MKIKVKSLLLSIKADISVIAKAHKKITVVRKRLGLNIIRHCLRKPIRNPEPAQEIRTPKEKHIAKVSGRPAMILITENQEIMSRTIPMHIQAPKAIRRSVSVSDGKKESPVSSSFLPEK